MAKNQPRDIADYIMPLYINGLRGRYLHMPAPRGRSRREILFVYGHHSSLERWSGVIQDLNRYGAVTMPDLPGFGGMDSFYKIGKSPTIDNMADYLAAFVKLHYKRKKVIIAGLSFGFVVVTRMLQRCPDLVNKVELLVSVVGFTHKDDFTFSRRRRLGYIIGCHFFSRRLTSLFFRYVCLNPLVLRLAYGHTHNAKQKFEHKDKAWRRRVMDFEIHLWHCNDARTWMRTTIEFLNLDNCDRRINLPVVHVAVKADHYFNEHIVEQHMRVVFSDFRIYKSKLANHAPGIIDDPKEAAALLPAGLRRLLAQR